MAGIFTRLYLLLHRRYVSETNPDCYRYSQSFLRADGYRRCREWIYSVREYRFHRRYVAVRSHRLRCRCAVCIFSRFVLSQHALKAFSLLSFYFFVKIRDSVLVYLWFLTWGYYTLVFGKIQRNTMRIFELKFELKKNLLAFFWHMS